MFRVHLAQVPGGVLLVGGDIAWEWQNGEGTAFSPLRVFNMGSIEKLQENYGDLKF